MPITITDVNSGTTSIINKQDVNAIYELDIYRQIVMNDAQIFDVTESYAHLTQEVGGGGGAPP